MSALRCPRCSADLPAAAPGVVRTSVHCRTCGMVVRLRQRQAPTGAAIPEAIPVDEEFHPDGETRRSGTSPLVWIGLGLGAMAVFGLLAIVGFAFYWALSPQGTGDVDEQEASAVAGDARFPFAGDRDVGVGADQLRYRWNGGGRFTYSLQIEAEKAEGVEVHEGNCQLAVTAGKADRGARPREGRGTGTAFVVHTDGYLVTCAHVVEDVSKLDVAIGGRTYPATVVNVDHARDVAVIRIAARNLPVLGLADSDAVEVGQEVRAIGYPLSSLLGDSIKATRGTISGIERRNGLKLLQVDASINPGNSGGPLVNEQGDVVGVISAKLLGNQVSNVGFSAPINDAKRLLQAKGVSFTTAGGQAKLEGPALVKKVSASTALVTMTLGGGGRVASADRFTLAVRSQLNKHERRGGLGERPIIGAREQSVVTMDLFGGIENVTGKANLPYLLGHPGTIFIEPLSSDGQDTWQESNTITIEETKRDGGGIQFGPRFGPRFGFPGLPGSDISRPGSGMRPGFPGFRGEVGPSGPGGFGPGGIGPGSARPGGFGPAIPPGANEPALPAESRRYQAEEVVTYRLSQATGDTITIHKTYELKTPGARPELSLAGDGQIVFDRKAGMSRSMNWKLTLTANSATNQVRIPITVTYRLLNTNELPAENPPSPPVEGQKPPMAPNPLARPKADPKPEPSTPADVNQLLAELSAADPHARQRAANALFRMTPTERRDEVARALEGVLGDSNGRARNSAIEALGVWGRPESVPKLIESAGHQDVFTRKAAIAALGSLKDPRAAESLAQRLRFLSDRADAGKALRAIGSPAEKAVAAMLQQGDVFTQREACVILKDIGTKESLSALETAKADKNGLVRRAAEDAIKTIGERK